MSQPHNIGAELNEHLKELHLPAIRRSFEEKARRAAQETLGYEQFLLELVELECQERRAHGSSGCCGVRVCRWRRPSITLT
jgi:hypothetical protein